jgi:hypothetical protein
MNQNIMNQNNIDDYEYKFKTLKKYQQDNECS